MTAGQRKHLQTDRVVLIPGPEGEVKVVREIFRLLIEEYNSLPALAERLNSDGHPAAGGKPWTSQRLSAILNSEKYCGNNIYNRTSSKLGSRRIRNPADHWVRVDGAFEPVIPASVYAQARAKMSNWTRRQTNQEVLRRLAAARDENGKLTAVSIGADPALPSAEALRRRFGSLAAAYDLIGHKPRRDLQYLDRWPRKHAVNAALLGQLRTHFNRDDVADPCGDPTLMSVRGGLAIRVATTFATRNDRYPQEWVLKIPYWRGSNITIVARIGDDDDAILDYFVFPSDAFNCKPIHFQRHNRPYKDRYRCDNFLDVLGRVDALDAQIA